MQSVATLRREGIPMLGHSCYPLAVAPKGTCVQVAAIHGKDDTKHFLGGLGFVEGAQISVVTEACGNLIADVKGARVALSCQMAGKIMVCDL